MISFSAKDGQYIIVYNKGEYDYLDIGLSRVLTQTTSETGMGLFSNGKVRFMRGTVEVQVDLGRFDFSKYSSLTNLRREDTSITLKEENEILINLRKEIERRANLVLEAFENLHQCTFVINGRPCTVSGGRGENKTITYAGCQMSLGFISSRILSLTLYESGAGIWGNGEVSFDRYSEDNLVVATVVFEPFDFTSARPDEFATELLRRVSIVDEAFESLNK